MRFQLPQFIQTEVKIVGPFTLKQFLWVAGGTSLIFLLFITVKGFFFFVLALPIGAVFAAFAFLKINDISLLDYASYFINYILNPKRYVFRKEQDKISFKNNGQ